MLSWKSFGIPGYKLTDNLLKEDLLGFRDKYAWNQTFEDVDIVVPTTIASTKMVSNKSLNLKLLTHARPDSSVARRLLNSYVVQNDVTNKPYLKRDIFL